jgi:uncharacterized damage-inducible protein DinB
MNRHLLSSFLAAASLVVAAPTAIAQTAATQTGTAVRDEIMRHFDESMSKFIALANAMPADKYTWKPSEPAMPVGHVYAHVARYNFWYLTREMKLPAAAGIGLDTIEAMRNKEQIVALLRRSNDYVRASIRAMPPGALDAQSSIYGRPAPQWAILVQLVAHMNEHLGQSIAYARSNNITPPWSQ